MATPQAALAAAYESWNAGDLDGYLSLYDEGIALHGYSPEPMNKDQVRGFYQGIFSAFDTPKLEFHEVLWDGDVAGIRFTMTGRHVDEFMGVPASGTAIALPGITILHFAATV
jgi:ketosteroid isomerase-like protein